MLVAATPIDPPDGDKCWAFHVINDLTELIESVIVESITYEWGDCGNSISVGARFGPVPPLASVEVFRETATEVRTSLTLRVRDYRGERRIDAEFGRLYSTPAPAQLLPIPILKRSGKLATLEIISR